MYGLLRDTGFRGLWLCELSPCLVRNSDGIGNKIADIGMRGLVKATVDVWRAIFPFL